MKFQNPAALWALLLIAIPIIIHLFNFRRYKKVYFSNITFLKNVQQQQKSSSTLRRLLILTTRILAIIFLVLAFAQPSLIKDERSMLTGRVAVYVDNSLSMQQGNAVGDPLLYVAATAASNLLKRQSAATELLLVTNDHLKIAPGTKVAQELLASPEFSHKTLTLEQLNQKVNARNVNRLVIFSDLQKSTTLPLEELLADTSRKVTLYRVESETPGNIYVDTVYLKNPLGLTSDNQLNFRIKNTGTKAAVDVLVKLRRDQLQLASFTTEVPAMSSVLLTLDIGINESISGNYTLSLEDNPVTFDNNFYFHIPNTKKPLVVLLTEKEKSPFEFVFANEEYFQFAKNNASNASFQDITRADLLILDELATIPSWLISQKEQLEGSQLVIPSENIELKSYAEFLGANVKNIASSVPSSVAVKSLSNPLFEGVFSDKNDRMDMPTVKSAYSTSRRTEELLKDNLGNTLLSKVNARAYFLTFPISDAYTNMHKHALFIPIMYRLAMQGNNTPLAYRLDQSTIAISSNELSQPDLVTLGSANESLIPSFRLLNGKLLITLPDVLTQPGFYNIITQNDTLGTLALNYNKKESEINPLSETEITSLLAGQAHVSVENINNSASLLSTSANTDKDTGLWKYALILALIFLITESVLLRFFR